MLNFYIYICSRYSTAAFHMVNTKTKIESGLIQTVCHWFRRLVRYGWRCYVIILNSVRSGSLYNTLFILEWSSYCTIVWQLKPDYRVFIWCIIYFLASSTLLSHVYNEQFCCLCVLFKYFIQNVLKPFLPHKMTGSYDDIKVISFNY